nr:MAG TPA: hypothetical protein [Caudoviricetes sp.]
MNDINCSEGQKIYRYISNTLNFKLQHRKDNLTWKN